MAERGWVRRTAPGGRPARGDDRGDRRPGARRSSASAAARRGTSRTCSRRSICLARRRLQGGLGVLRKVFAGAPASGVAEKSQNTGEAQVVSILDGERLRWPQTTTADGDREPGPMSLPARMAGVLFSPRATYATPSRRGRACSARWPLIIAGDRGGDVPVPVHGGRPAGVARRQRAPDGVVRADGQRRAVRADGADGSAIHATSPRSSSWFSSRSWRSSSPGSRSPSSTRRSAATPTFKQVYAIVVSFRRASWWCRRCSACRSPTRARTLSGTTNLGVFVPFLDESSFAARMLRVDRLVSSSGGWSASPSAWACSTGGAPGRLRPPCSSSTRRSG